MISKKTFRVGLQPGPPAFIFAPFELSRYKSRRRGNLGIDTVFRNHTYSLINKTVTSNITVTSVATSNIMHSLKCSLVRP